MSNARSSNPFNLCSFTFANGRLCGLPAHPKGDGLCLVHVRRSIAAAKPREDDLSRELASPAGDFMTQMDLNHVLGKLFHYLAANRITPRRASSLAYIAYLISQTQKGAKAEAQNWEQDIPIFKKWADVKYPGLAKQFAAWNAAAAAANLTTPPAAASSESCASESCASDSRAADTPASDPLANIPAESLTIS